MTGLFYPSLVVNLVLRLDEALLSGAMPSPKSAASLATSPGNVVLPVAGSQLTQVLGLVPKACSVELPAYRQAGKFTINLEFKDFPLDPRILRAASAEVHLGAVPAGDFGRGLVQISGKRSSIINTRTASGGIRSDTLLLLGYVDSITAEHTTSGSMISMEGRDPRGILLDTAAPAEVVNSLELDLPLQSVVHQVLMLHPILGAHPPKVFLTESDWNDGAPIVSKSSDITRVNKGASGEKAKLPMKGGADSLNFWDLITQVCFLCGAIPFFTGDGLRIRRSRSLYEQQQAGTPTPFARGAPRKAQVQMGDRTQTIDLRVRRLVYGKDILTLKLDRKIQGSGKRPAVMVVSTDTGSEAKGFKGRGVSARWPEEPSSTNVDPEGKSAQDEVLRIPVPGIRSVEQLKSLARDLYEEIGRQEIGGSVSTKDLTSFGGNNQDPDLLHLRPGDAIEILAASNLPGSGSPIISELNSQAGKSTAERMAYLAERLGDAELARVLVSAMDAVGKLQTTFRVSTVRFSWDASSGVGLDFDFQNYVEARV